MVVEEQRVKFLPDGKIQGWADTGEGWSDMKIVLSDKALVPSIESRAVQSIPLVYGHGTDKIIGVFDVLEYRDGKLWCEATLSQPVNTAYAHYFSVAFLLQDFYWDSDDNVHVKSGHLYEIAIHTVQKHDRHHQIH